MLFLFGFSFAKLEARLQAMIEGGAARLFPARFSPGDLARQLAAAMQTGQKHHPGQWTAPDQYRLVVHPGFAHKIKDRLDLLDWLLGKLKTSAVELDLVFLNPPTIQVVEDSTLPHQLINVQALFSLAVIQNTSDVEIEAISQDIPPGAYLIVNGIDTFPIDRSVTNLGRRPDNHLVIDDPRVSRLHAQIRSINGFLVLFDLDSIGGTLVNGNRIQECALSAGDVISLAGVPLVFNQEKPGIGTTQKIDLLSEEKPVQL